MTIHIATVHLSVVQTTALQIILLQEVIGYPRRTVALVSYIYFLSFACIIMYTIALKFILDTLLGEYCLYGGFRY